MGRYAEDMVLTHRDLWIYYLQLSVYYAQLAHPYYGTSGTELEGKIGVSVEIFP